MSETQDVVSAIHKFEGQSYRAKAKMIVIGEFRWLRMLKEFYAPPSVHLSLINYQPNKIMGRGVQIDYDDKEKLEVRGIKD